MLNHYSVIPHNSIIACLYWKLTLTFAPNKQFRNSYLKNEQIETLTTVKFWDWLKKNWINCQVQKFEIVLSNNKTAFTPNQSSICCIFQPAFGCYALQTLVKIFFFNIFWAKKLEKLKRRRKLKKKKNKKFDAKVK